MITYTKLKDGSWGLRGSGLVSNTAVTVTKRDGTTKQERVGKVLWTGDGVSLATIDGNGSNSHTPATSTRYGRHDGHKCRNGHAPHPGPCCTGRHRGGDDCGCDCCEMD